MASKLKQILKIKDVRNSILFVLGMLVVFRFAAHIPVPGIDASSLVDFFQSNQFLGLLNVFSGGTLENFSIVALGVAPYITSSIIFQLLTMIVPRLEEMQKDGEAGRQKINQYTRLLTLPLAALQAYGLITIFRQQVTGFAIDLSTWEFMLAIVTMSAGTVFLMWIGELISERHIGNGISLLIFAGIIAGLPTFVQRSIVTFDRSQIITMVLFGAAAILTIVGVVIINEAQRKIPVQYAKHVRGKGSMGGVKSFLPLRVNMAGVIPIIFAISIVLFPPMIAQFFINARTEWIADFANWVIIVFQNQLFYGIIYFALVFGFTYFYTAVIFHPDQIADNLQKQGGFIPGIRPGNTTAEYLNRIANRILLAGALFLSAIAVMPLAMQQFTGSQMMVIGGTSILIIVSVVVEMVKQVESQITMREYDSL